MEKNKKQIDIGKILLIIFSALLVILILKTFLIPMSFSMVGILLGLVELYKLLEMPYLFFGTALFLYCIWYLFVGFVNLAYRLIKFIATTSIYKTKKEKDPEGEIREGAYCTQCGKHIKEGKWQQRDGHLEKYFFGLLEKDIWERYFCSDKCYRKFVRTSEKDEKDKKKHKIKRRKE